MSACCSLCGRAGTGDRAISCIPSRVISPGRTTGGRVGPAPSALCPPDVRSRSAMDQRVRARARHGLRGGGFSAASETPFSVGRGRHAGIRGTRGAARTRAFQAWRHRRRPRGRPALPDRGGGRGQRVDHLSRRGRRTARSRTGRQPQLRPAGTAPALRPPRTQHAVRTPPRHLAAAPRPGRVAGARLHGRARGAHPAPALHRPARSAASCRACCWPTRSGSAKPSRPA
jgi:hypothetical protein